MPLTFAGLIQLKYGWIEDWNEAEILYISQYVFAGCMVVLLCIALPIFEIVRICRRKDRRREVFRPRFLSLVTRLCILNLLIFLSEFEDYQLVSMMTVLILSPIL